MLAAEIARPALHLVHLLAFAALLATGLLLLSADLRAATVGGYALWLGTIHCWVGIAFVVTPLAIMMGARTPILFVAPASRSLRTTWQALHVGVTVAMTVLFAVTGFALWGENLVSEATVDASRTAHDWLTGLVVAFVALHLLEVGTTNLMNRIRATTPDPPQLGGDLDAL